MDPVRDPTGDICGMFAVAAVEMGTIPGMVEGTTGGTETIGGTMGCANPVGISGMLAWSGGTIPVGIAPGPLKLGRTGTVGGITGWGGRLGGGCGLGGSGRGGAGTVGGDCTLSDASNVGGTSLGISKPRSFKLMSLHAMENSLMSILPSASVSASDLQKSQSSN